MSLVVRLTQRPSFCSLMQSAKTKWDMHCLKKNLFIRKLRLRTNPAEKIGKWAHYVQVSDWNYKSSQQW